MLRDMYQKSNARYNAADIHPAQLVVAADLIFRLQIIT